MNSPWEPGWPDLLRSMGCGVGPPLVSPPAARGPSVPFLHKKVWDGRALGRLYRVTVVSSVYPAASPEGVRWGTPWRRCSRLPQAGSPWGCPVHPSSWGFLQRCRARCGRRHLLLGERVPHTAFAPGSALCPRRTGFFPGLSYRHLCGLALPGTVQGSAQAPSVLPEG